MRLVLASAATAAALSAVSALAFAHVAVGAVITNADLPALGGGRQPLLTNAAANVFVFFKPGQEHSRAVLRQIAACERDLAGKPVHWVAIASSRFTRDQIEADVKEAGLAMPVLIDEDDALYGRLGVVLSPVTGITDREHKLVAYLPFAKVNYETVLRAHLRRLLGEIDDHELAETLSPPPATQGGDAEVARRRFKLAERLFQSGNYPAARASALKSIEKDPGFAAAHALLGQILAAQGQRPEALQAFEQALKLDPANTNAQAAIKSLQNPPAQR